MNPLFPNWDSNIPPEEKANIEYQLDKARKTKIMKTYDKRVFDGCGILVVGTMLIGLILLTAWIL